MAFPRSPREVRLGTDGQPKHRRKDSIKINADTTTEATAKDQTPKAKAEKITKKTKAEADGDADAGDRLPGNLEELKAAKGGLVSFLFLSGKDKEAIAAELKTAFKLGDAQAVKIVRRITGRVRLFQRVFELMAAK